MGVTTTLHHPLNFARPSTSTATGGIPLMFITLWEEINETGVGTTASGEAVKQTFARWDATAESELTLLSQPGSRKIRLGVKPFTLKHGQKQQHQVNLTNPTEASTNLMMSLDSHGSPWYKVEDWNKWRSCTMYSSLSVSKYTMPGFDEDGYTLNRLGS